MRVEEATVSGRSVVVQTTGARYTFDTERNTIRAEQLLEKPREVAVWTSSLPLGGLQVLSRNPKECVLANDRVTFGVQCDSLVMIVPHQELALSLDSKMGGEWNRLSHGNLLVMDRWGGFAATPDIPPGTGRLARVDVGVMAGRPAKGEMDFAGIDGSSMFVSQVSPGWQATWHLSPGERLAISTFPPKPYPWKESFRSSLCLHELAYGTQQFAEREGITDIMIFWDAFQRTWAFSWGREHVPAMAKSVLAEHIAAAKQRGMAPIVYMSPWFCYSRDPQEFAREVRRMRDEYDFGGVYFDGLPTDDWLATYEEMRLTREALPDGKIVVHNTYPVPMLNQDIEQPAVAAYADVVWTGECIAGEDADWPYARYMVSNFRKSNTVGILNNPGEYWRIPDRLTQELLLLKYDGRPTYRHYPAELGAVFEALHQLWQEKGAEPDFYERYYLPRWRELTKGLVPE
jgi:hypothetical protein